MTTNRKPERSRSVSWGNRSGTRAGRTVALVLVAALILPMLIIGPTTVVESKAHPALTEIAAANPEATVRVIAQMAGEDADAVALVEGIGGRFLKDLHIIDAFVARMSAEEAVELAHNPGVRWVSLDGAVEQAGKPPKDPPADPLPENTYLDTLNVRAVWDMGYTGEGIGVAILDSGINTDRDFSTTPGKPFSRIEKAVAFADNTTTNSDLYGHGTHVAGIAGGHGGESGGLYSGIAPKIDLVNLKVSDDLGMAYESDVVEALQWVLDNKDQYNIRVVNMSINSTSEMSYHNSPLDAAAEIVWFNGIVVVAAAGNRSADWSWDTIDTAPANDPFVITVGASHENGDSNRLNDYMPGFSANDITMDGIKKPDVVAPGKDIISVLASSSDWYYDYPERAVMDKEYFRISGTSMSAPMVTGAIALLLQAEPGLTPDQVKYRLMNTGSYVFGDFAGTGNEFAYLDVHELLTTPTTESANTGLEASQLLTTGDDPIDSSVSWNSVSWNSVSWNSVSWNSVSWNSVSWNSVSWNSVSWDD